MLTNFALLGRTERQNVIDPAQRVQTVSDEIRGAVAQADQRFSALIGRGDAAAAAKGVYTRDASILPPGAKMIRGRDAIVEFWRAAVEQGLEAAELETVELRVAGEFIHQIGRALLTVQNQPVPAKYAVLWKQEDGQWKWHVDVWNTDQ